MARLRGECGCEWDRAQTHESIRINLIEEAYELVEAIDCADRDMMLEESGDVLMQAVFHTQIASESGEFDYSDMLTALCRKLLDRHTHIFGENHANNADEALNFWNEAKKKEKKYTSNTDAMQRVPKNLPSLLYAEKSRKSQRNAVLTGRITNPRRTKSARNLRSFAERRRAPRGRSRRFAVCRCQRAQIFKVEPETALREANAKFLRRFAAVEERVKAQGKEMTDFTLEQLDKIWDEVKRDERKTE